VTDSGPEGAANHCPRCGAVTSDDEDTHRCAAAPATTLVDEDEPEDTDPEAKEAAALADDPSSSLGPLDTLDPGSDEPTGAAQRPGATLILADGEDAAEGEGAAARLSPGFGELKVVALVRGAPAQANVTVDGVARGPSPAVLAVLPGQHLVKVERVGFGAAEKTVTVRAAGEQALAQLEVKPAKRR
jgi:hypothetical protein